MPTRKILLLIVAVAGLAGAQKNPYGPLEMQRQQWLDRVFQEQLEQSHSRQEKEIAERRQARLREQQFLRLAHQFLDLWNEVAREYNTRRAVNPKKLKAASKAFRALESSEGWFGAR